jgi:hypothetical protein
MYADGASVYGVTLSVPLITYNCGDVIILDGYETQYHFAPPGNNGRDVPNGFVTFYIGATNQASSTNASYVEMIVPPKYGWGNGTVSSANVGHTLLDHPLTLDPPRKAYYLWDLKGKTRNGLLNTSEPSYANTTLGAANSYLYFNGTATADRNRRFPFNNTGNHQQTASSAFSGLTARSTSPSKYVIFNYGQVIPNGQTRGPFIVPPGEYWCRYWDNYSGGNVYGATSTRWRYVDLRSMGGQTAYATLDNTTRFQWLGQESVEEDELINPTTQAPWVMPVTAVKGVAAGTADTLNRNVTVSWTRPSPIGEYKGALVALFDSDGFQVGNAAAITPKLGMSITGAGATTGTIVYKVIYIRNSYDSDGTVNYEEVYAADNVTLIGGVTFPRMANGQYIWRMTDNSNGSVIVTGLPNGLYDVYVWSYTNDLGEANTRRYSEPTVQNISK